jgi:hypothetical protein
LFIGAFNHVGEDGAVQVAFAVGRSLSAGNYGLCAKIEAAEQRRGPVAKKLCVRWSEAYLLGNVLGAWVFSQVIPEGAGPVKTTAAFAFACFGAS